MNASLLAQSDHICYGARVQTVNLIGPDGPALGINRMRPQDPQRVLHRHDNLELVLITAGSGEHRTPEGRFRLGRGDVFVIPPRMPHGYPRADGLELVNLGYDPARLDLPLRRLLALPGYQALVALEPHLRQDRGFAGHLHLDDAALRRCLLLVDELEGELHRREPGWEQSAAGWLLQLLVQLARAYARLDHPAARRALALAGVLDHLDRHLAEPLDLAGLSRLAGCSPATLQRRFRAVVGSSVIDHLITLRLAAARDRLAAGDEAVAMVARHCGFDHPGYFARAFRRAYGCSPREWRAKSRSNS
jgi:AraC-like DNA-binding protein